MGVGVSVSAHQKWKMIDGYDIVGREDPVATTRWGSVPVAELVRYARDIYLSEIKAVCTRTGGFVSHLGTSDGLEVYNLAKEGHKEATLVWETMLYQISKCIGAMASVLHGEVEGILLGGGMVYNEDLVSSITQACQYIAPIYAYPGEFEMEAMAAGAIRVLEGKEVAKVYTGEACWKGFDFE